MVMEPKDTCKRFDMARAPPPYHWDWDLKLVTIQVPCHHLPMHLRRMRAAVCVISFIYSKHFRPSTT